MKFLFMLVGFAVLIIVLVKIAPDQTRIPLEGPDRLPGMLVTVVGVVFVAVVYIPYARYTRIDKNGLLAEAMPPYNAIYHSGGKFFPYYTIQLQFTTQGGREISVDSQHVHRHTNDKIEAGEPVMVKYIADNPSEVIVLGDPESGHGRPDFFLLLGFLTIAMGVYLIFVPPEAHEYDDE